MLLINESGGLTEELTKFDIDVSSKGNNIFIFIYFHLFNVYWLIALF